MRSVVVLPHPDGPSMAKNSPSSIDKIDGVDGGDVAETLRDAGEFDGSSHQLVPQS